MIIEFEGCSFRIKGERNEWQVQYPRERKDGRGDGWEGKHFFPSLRWALDKAYELALQEDADTVDVKAAIGKFERAKDAMIKACERAVAR